jgi:hypothetical protein
LIARSIANRASMPPLDRLDGDRRLRQMLFEMFGAAIRK